MPSERNKLIITTPYFNWSLSCLSLTTAGHACIRKQNIEKLWVIRVGGHNGYIIFHTNSDDDFGVIRQRKLRTWVWFPEIALLLCLTFFPFWLHYLFTVHWAVLCVYLLVETFHVNTYPCLFICFLVVCLQVELSGRLVQVYSTSISKTWHQ